MKSCTQSTDPAATTAPRARNRLRRSRWECKRRDYRLTSRVRWDNAELVTHKGRRARGAGGGTPPRGGRIPIAPTREAEPAAPGQLSASLFDIASSRFAWSNLPTIDADGKRGHVAVVATDVAERRRFEDELTRSEERFRLVASATNDVVWDWNLLTNTVWWNEGVLAIFGHDPTAPENAAWWSECLHPDDREKTLHDMRVAVAGSGPFWQARYRLGRSDGAYADVADRGFIIRDAAGKAVRMIGALRDVTAEKRGEEILRASEERYRLLFENNPQPMWVFDDETLAFLAVNAAACRHYGYGRDEFLAMTIRDIRPPEDVSALAQRLATEPREYQESGVWRHRRKDGTIMDVEIASHPLTFEGRPAQLVLATDITDRRKLESQLRQSQKMEAIGQLAGGIAHDFNNLLTAILGYAALLSSQLPKDEILQEEIGEISKAGQRAATLTRQLLAFSRLQVLEPRVLDLNASVRGIETMLRRLIGEHIELVTILEPSLASVRADAGQIEQVILNLVVNSRDAMPDGGRLVIRTGNLEMVEAEALRQASTHPGHYVMLTVSDTGSGMDAATQARIYEPFFSTKTKDRGTGLGLSTVYGIVQQSGGSIWSASEVGKGTTFKVFLPMADGVAAAAEASPPDRTAAPATETILLVEDDPSLRKLALRILKGLGYTVLEASAGPAALALAKQYPGSIDLVLSDVVMPRMTGSEFVSALRVLRPEVSVLYMSGYNDDAIIRHHILEAKAAFLQKPFTPASLAEKIRDVLNARERAPALQ
jgi:two-component system cell cycle sensor histidine kinase/response regulator CckA